MPKITHWVACSNVQIWWVNDTGNPSAKRDGTPIPISTSTSLTDVPTRGRRHTYVIFNTETTSAPLTLMFVGGCAILSSSAFIQTRSGQFEVLVPRRDVIKDYTHNKGTLLKRPWKHVHTLRTTDDDDQNHGYDTRGGPSPISTLKSPETGDDDGQSQTKVLSVSLIQSVSGKLEAIARISRTGEKDGDYLIGYEADPTSDWKGPVKLVADDGPINAVTGSSALIQSNYDALDKFELLVPRATVKDGAVLDHYVHEKGTILEGAWTHIETLRLLEDDAVGQVKVASVSLTQSFSGKLEVIARLSPPEEGNDYLVGYEFDPTTMYWKGPVKLVADDGPINAVTGSPALIQSNYDTPDKFELLVPRRDASGRAVLDHYIHEMETIVEGPWKLVYTLKLPDDDPQSQAKAVWLIQSASKKLEAIARISPSSNGDDYVVGYEFDQASGWQGPVKLVADDGPILIGEPNVVIQ